MLVFADGSQAGTLGGGCVEAEVEAAGARRSWRQATAGRSARFQPRRRLRLGRRPDLRRPDDQSWSIRSRRAAEPSDYFGNLRRLSQSRRAGCTEAVVIDAEASGLPAGGRYLFDADGQLIAPLRGPADGCPRVVRKACIPLAERPRPARAHGHRLSADPAARHAVHRRRRARRPGGRQVWPPRSISTSGSSTTAPSTSAASAFPPPSGDRRRHRPDAAAAGAGRSRPTRIA